MNGLELKKLIDKRIEMNSMINRQRVGELINNKVETALTLHKKDIIELSKVAMREELHDFKDAAIKDMKDASEEIFNNMEFLARLKQEFYRFINQEIKSQLSKEEIRDVIKYIIEDISKNKFNNVIEKIVSQVICKMNKKLSYENKVTKELCQSIDSTIKHTMIHSPISYESEKVMKKKISDTINQVTQMQLKKLEQKDEVDLIE